MLQGKKTYISGALIAGVTFLRLTDLITQQTFEALLALFGALGLIALRQGITTEVKKTCTDDSGAVK